MKTCDIKIDILDKNYMDSLIIALVRQGYEVYAYEEQVCFRVPENEINIEEE